jgi:uncharacterized protein
MIADVLIIIKPPLIYIEDSGEEIGRGVYSTHGFFKDEIVEVAPVSLLDVNFEMFPKELQTRVYNWGFLTKSNIKHAIAMGYGSMYNHSDYPNLRYEADTNFEVIRYIALRNIAPNEQLTIHYDQYDGIHEHLEDHWFNRNKIQKRDIG